MPGTQELTRRIKSIKSTRKVTRAMQLVSAAKMRKAQAATIASRTYAGLAWELINSLNGAFTAGMSPLLETHAEAKKIGVVLVTTNRGLVGSFNTNLLKKVLAMEGEETELISELVVVGRKGKEGMTRLRKHIIAEFPKTDTTITVRDVYPIIHTITEAYKTGEYRNIVVVYNKFISTLTQEPTIQRLLPLVNPQETTEVPKDVIFEPSKETVLNHLLPRILESQLYQAILESDASEHSARMIMMKNATESAGDLIDDLTLTYNQLRQNKITTELSEITAGKIALEKK